MHFPWRARFDGVMAVHVDSGLHVALLGAVLSGPAMPVGKPAHVV